MDLHDSARAAARVVRELGAAHDAPRWFISCDTDADGVCAAAVAATALRRLGHRFQVHGSRDKEKAAYETLLAREADGFLVLDKGTSHIDLLATSPERRGRPVVVIDHHNLVHEEVPGGVTLLNPRAVGLDGGRDASSSTTAVAFAIALDAQNLDQAATGLCGAIGDWQHMGGWQGWNRDLIDRALAAGLLERRTQPALIGVTLAHALAHRPTPLPGLADDVPAARALLAELGIDPACEVEDLSRDEQTRLLSAVTLRCLEAGWTRKQVEGLVLETLVHPRFDTSLRHVFRLVDACGREGDVGTGIAMLMGDAGARDDAEVHFGRYKRTLGEGLEALRAGGTRRLQAVQHHAIDRAAYTGMVAGIGMTHVIEDSTVPVCVTAPRPDGDLQVSTRGTHAQVEAGMDLGRACQEAAATVGREGGGHPIAAGAVIAADHLDRFLEALDQALVAQQWLEAVAA